MEGGGGAQTKGEGKEERKQQTLSLPRRQEMIPATDFFFFFFTPFVRLDGSTGSYLPAHQRPCFSSAPVRYDERAWALISQLYLRSSYGIRGGGGRGGQISTI